MTARKSQLVTNPPDYIKQWYKDTAENKGLKMQPFSTMVLCEYAIANGAEELKDKRNISKDRYIIEH